MKEKEEGKRKKKGREWKERRNVEGKEEGEEKEGRRRERKWKVKKEEEGRGRRGGEKRVQEGRGDNPFRLIEEITRYWKFVVTASCMAQS